MKKILLSLVSLLLAFSLLFSLAACSGGANSNDDVTPTSAPSSDDSPTPGEDYTEGGKFVDYNHYSVDPSIKLQAYDLPNKTVTYLTSAGYTEPDATKHSIIRDVYGVTIEPIHIGNDDYTTKLITLTMGGEAPDLTHAGNSLSLISRGILQPWNNYIDIETNLWKDLENCFNNVRINGSVYTLRERPSRWDFCWYNKEIFEENGITTPKELLEQGNWTWDTFRDAAKALTIDEDSDGVPEIWGAAIQTGLYLVYSTGTSLVSIEPDGSVSNNIRSEKVARAVEFYTQLSVSDSVLYDGSDQKEQFGAGKVAMLWGGLWFKVAFLDMLKEGIVDFVPFPRDPQADKYYIYEQFAFYSLPTDAKNPQGAAAYMNSIRYSTMVVDEEERAERDALSVSEQVDIHGWPNELSDYMLEELYGNPEYVPVEMTYTTFNLGQFFGDIWFRPLLGEPWSAIAEELYPKINEEIASLLEQ